MSNSYNPVSWTKCIIVNCMIGSFKATPFNILRSKYVPHIIRGVVIYFFGGGGRFLTAFRWVADLKKDLINLIKEHARRYIRTQTRHKASIHIFQPSPRSLTLSTYA